MTTDTDDIVMDYVSLCSQFYHTYSVLKWVKTTKIKVCTNFVSILEQWYEVLSAEPWLSFTRTLVKLPYLLFIGLYHLYKLFNCFKNWW